MRSPVQQALVQSLASVLRPIIRLLLNAGIGYSEFAAVAKEVFVRVASESFGLRGRPTNISRVSAITAISRKEVSRIRKRERDDRWTPDMETTPANTVIHYWHFDPAYSDTPGVPRALPFQGSPSFSSLVAEYAGDIPPGAVRTELQRAGTIRQLPNGFLIPDRRYFYSPQFDSDFVKRIAFSLANLCSTVAHNAELNKDSAITEEENDRLGRFERCAWTERMSSEMIEAFRTWVRTEGTSFVERADAWIGENELQKTDWQDDARRVVGVGVYYFEEDERPT
jgi:Family of unknown function (DUF6502)